MDILSFHVLIIIIIPFDTLNICVADLLFCELS